MRRSSKRWWPWVRQDDAELAHHAERPATGRNGDYAARAARAASAVASHREAVFQYARALRGLPDDKTRSVRSSAWRCPTRLATWTAGRSAWPCGRRRSTSSARSAMTFGPARPSAGWSHRCGAWAAARRPHARRTTPSHYSSAFRRAPSWPPPCCGWRELSRAYGRYEEALRLARPGAGSREGARPAGPAGECAWSWTLLSIRDGRRGRRRRHA